MYPPHALGGYEQSCRDVMVRMRRNGHRITVLTTTMRLPDVPDDRDDDIDVRRELRFYWDDHVLVSPPPRERLRIERHNQRVLERALRDVRPDVLSVWNMGAMSMGLVAALSASDVPTVYAVCDDWLLYGPQIDPWTSAWRRRRHLAPLAARLTRVPTTLPADLGERGAFCFVSEWTRRRALEESRWTFPCSTVVYSGIDPSDFRQRSADTPRHWQWRLLYVGRVEGRKGVETAIRALTHLPEEATLRVVGRAEPEHRRHLDQVISELGLAARVSFDVAARDELAAIYAGADVVLFPPVWDEPFGLVPVEAMACDTPVVASATGGSQEFLFDGVNCLCAERGDAASFAAAVRRLAADEQLRSQLVRAGRDTAADLTVDRLADVFENWHVAAADRFRDGVPPQRPRPRASGPAGS
jgi:glycosyltransferase involved in cell wall biosynthesis